VPVSRGRLPRKLKPPARWALPQEFSSSTSSPSHWAPRALENPCTAARTTWYYATGRSRSPSCVSELLAFEPLPTACPLAPPGPRTRQLPGLPRLSTADMEPQRNVGIIHQLATQLPAAIAWARLNDGTGGHCGDSAPVRGSDYGGCRIEKLFLSPATHWGHGRRPVSELSRSCVRPSEALNPPPLLRPSSA